MANRVLAITSSTAVVGVAIADGGTVVAFEEITTDRRHAEELTPMVQRVLSAARLPLQDIDTLAVDVGPGRFTGMRVGLATARSLAFALDIPVVGVTSLEILAAAQPGFPVTAVIDARRAEVFQQTFSPDGSSDLAIVGPAEELVARIGPDNRVVGDGGDRYHELYGPRLIPNQAPSASVLALMAEDREPRPGRQIEPVYLRDPDVQINIKTRHNT